MNEPSLSMRSKILFWVATFLVLHVYFLHNWNGNTMSRFTLLWAMCEGELSIDPYVDDSPRLLTTDWAQTPDGHYYSNKAPGPVLMAFPLYAPLDRWLTRNASTREERDDIRFKTNRWVQHYLSLLLQGLPMAIVTFLGLRRLERRGCSPVAIDCAALAALFGNTAVIYTNIYFAHAMSAWMVIALFLSMDSRRYGWAGFWVGWLVLTEYTLVALVPIVAWCLWRDRRCDFAAVLWRFVAGGLPTFVAFTVYHQICFGGPLTPAVAYQNPMFLDVPKDGVGGIFHKWPSPAIADQLVFGARVGLLYVVPWIFVMAAWSWTLMKGLRQDRLMVELGLGGLLILIVVISAFGGWHGGRTAGPRYLAAVMPLCGLALGAEYDRMPAAAHTAVQLTLWVAVVFTLLAIAVDIVPWVERNVWSYYGEQLQSGAWKRERLSLAFWGAVLTVGWCWQPRPKVV